MQKQTNDKKSDQINTNCDNFVQFPSENLVKLQKLFGIEKTFAGEENGQSRCNCSQFKGSFHQKIEYFYLNGKECPKMSISCEQVSYSSQLFLMKNLSSFSLKKLCEYNQQCFNMSRTVRRGYIGNSYIVQDKVYKVYGPIRHSGQLIICFVF